MQAEERASRSHGPGAPHWLAIPAPQDAVDDEGSRVEMPDVLEGLSDLAEDEEVKQSRLDVVLDHPYHPRGAAKGIRPQLLRWCLDARRA